MLDKADLEQIKGLLEPIVTAQEAQGRTQEEHSKTLADHSKLLADHSKKLDDHSKKLDDHSKKLDDHSKKLDDHGKKLDDHGSEIVKINITLENRIIPMMNLLMEGQQAIIDRLIPVSRVEKIEEDVTVLKVAVRQLNDDVQKLKRAQ